MKHKHLIALAAIVIPSSAVFAQGSIDWHVICGGGGESALLDYTLSGSIGQIDAGEVLEVGGYSLSGGFWLGDATPHCPADLDNGSGNGIPDGGIDVNDLLYFLSSFQSGSLAADLDNGAGTGTPDGGVDVNDLLFFLERFEAGC